MKTCLITSLKPVIIIIIIIIINKKKKKRTNVTYVSSINRVTTLEQSHDDHCVIAGSFLVDIALLPDLLGEDLSGGHYRHGTVLVATAWC
jgi:hypothetical protein